MASKIKKLEKCFSSQHGEIWIECDHSTGEA